MQQHLSSIQPGKWRHSYAGVTPSAVQLAGALRLNDEPCHRDRGEGTGSHHTSPPALLLGTIPPFCTMMVSSRLPVSANGFLAPKKSQKCHMEVKEKE